MKDLSLHLLDIARNSIKASATQISISMTYHEGKLRVTVTDNGCGMEPDFVEKVTDPFTTTRDTRAVGMGIPLLKHSAELTGGSLEITSEKNVGTVVDTLFVADSIDRIPVGDVDETMKLLIQANPELDYEIRFRNGTLEYELKTIDVKTVLNGLHITSPEVINWIGKNIREGLKEVFGGVLNEITG